ncbi:hypothetical protein TrVGV298_006604 [Trichoderma virens]|nr:hypothetical protein TrVGV298_006604 [Trichoderma virens]
MPDARQEHDVDACLDTIVIDTPQGLTPERCDPTPPEPSRTYIRDFEDDALLDLYYKNFHKLHPLVLPQRHLVRLSQEADTQPRLVPLVAVMRLIGHLYGSREWSFPLQDALKTCFSQASQRDPFMVQCRVLYSIALFWYGYKTEAKNEIGMAARLALDLEMFRCQFATEQGGRNPVLAESWRRTWWMLFIVNGYYIGTVGTLEFALIDVEATVELPCGEFEYESGEIPKPKTLEDFDSREFALGNTSFSSFAYLVGAARCVASAAPMALGITPEDASLQVINTADSILDGWLLLLPRGSKQIMDKSGEIDELMFQAKLLVHVATISLHRPLSDLKFNTAEAISSCARKPPPDIPTPEMCDHGVPTCRRCLRTGAVCGGYRDKLDLAFRDQTRQVIRRCNQTERTAKSPIAATQPVGKPREAEPTGQPQESNSLLTSIPSVPITDQAVCFFFLNFVLTDPISGGGHLEYLPVIYDTITRDLALPTVVAAIGMAGIANLRRSRDLLLAANSQYLLAIQLTQAALMDETLRIQDQTLVSILLLALYEIIQALQRSQHVPNEIRRWSTKALGLQSASQAFEDQLHRLAMDLCSLRASAENVLLADRPTIISRACALDGNLADWSRRLSIKYGIAIDNSLGVKENLGPEGVNSYSDVHVSNAINCHTLRILTNELILNMLDQVKGQTAVDYQRLRSQYVIHTLIAEVCASVLSFTSRDRQQAGFIARGSFLLWPLYVVSAVPWTSQLYRDWAIVQLKELGAETGILQAALLARELQIKGEISYWDKEANDEEDDY